MRVLQSRERPIATHDDPPASIHTTTAAIPAQGLDAAVVKEWLYIFAGQSLDYAILLVGIDKTVLWANPGAAWVLAATVSEIVGRPISVFFTPEDRAFGIPDHEQRTALRQGSSDDDRWMLRADGSRFWASGRTVALAQRDGTAMGFFKMFRDQTELKMHVDALDQQAGSVQADRTIPADARPPVASRAAPLPRIESLVLHEELEAAIASAVRRVDAGARQIQLLLPPGTALTVDADREEVRELFAILVENAVRATPDRGRIWINATLQDEEAVVRVEDNGRGIDPGRFEEIAVLFTTPVPSDRAGRLGTVKSIVEQHGGTVQARSAGPGKGSEFIVRLPLRREHGPGIPP